MEEGYQESSTSLDVEETSYREQNHFECNYDSYQQ